VSLRVELGSLPEDVRRSIAASEPVEVADHGAVVARVEPERAETDCWRRFLNSRRDDPPLDYDAFLLDLAAIRQSLNQPLDEARWA